MFCNMEFDSVSLILTQGDCLQLIFSFIDDYIPFQCHNGKIKYYQYFITTFAYFIFCLRI